MLRSSKRDRASRADDEGLKHVGVTSSFQHVTGDMPDDESTSRNEGPSPRALLKLYLLLFCYRAANALFVRTYYDPDEYWQALEVAHKLSHAFFLFLLWSNTYGYLTWEWTHKIRGFAHPLIFTFIYKTLAVLGMDDTELLIVAPRLVQAGFAAVGDIYTYLLAYKLFGHGAAKWALICSILSWYTFFCGIRTFSNSMESVLTVAALYYWPWASEGNFNNIHRKHFRVSLAVASLACIVRPTNAIIWLYLGVNLVWKNTRMWKKIALDALTLVVLALQASVLIDYIFYKEWTVVPYNFIRQNLVEGIATFYGNHSWHWYFSQGFPVITLSFLPVLVWDTVSTKGHQGPMRVSLLRLVLWTLCVYTLLPHKEFRFIFPILPPTIALTGAAIDRIESSRDKVKARRCLYRNRIPLLITFLVITNGLAGYYLGTVHQRGVVDVMNWLREEAAHGRIDGILFLMPCHSTPFYSHLHRNVSMRFLTCEPPVGIDRSTYTDEADIFYQSPKSFIETYFDPKMTSIGVATPSYHDDTIPVPGQDWRIQRFYWPSLIVIFEALSRDMLDIFKGSDYEEVR
ncbi:hypothetical protein SpCBS45565_g07106 [Spizellomyces sp. 'palustris']|nr:hypothetical protein SpCBS45565_g07106 [Spizellomyces sp. 'palustris']